MPEEVRRARTTGGTCHQNKSKEVKDVSDCLKGSIDMEIQPVRGLPGNKCDDLVACQICKELDELYEVRSEEIFDDGEAQLELDNIIANVENLEKLEESLNSVDDFWVLGSGALAHIPTSCYFTDQQLT